MLLLSLLYILINLLRVDAVGITSAIGASCIYMANNFTLYPFNCKPPDLGYSCRCRDPSFLGTVLICIDDNADTAELVTEAYNYILEVCWEQGYIKYDFRQLVSVFENATKYVISETPPNAAIISRPVLPNKELYLVSNRSVHDLVTHRQDSTFILGVGVLCGYWVLVILIGTINNIGVWCAPSIRMNVLNTPVNNFVRYYLTITHGNRLTQVTKLLPTKLQSLTIVIYLFLIIITCCAVPYSIPFPNTIFKFKWCGTLVYIADRTGIVAITQLPLLVIFAGRNNILMTLTGWSYRAFSIYHRWIARFTWVLMLVHALCYVNYSSKNNDYLNRWGLEKWRWANTAMICSGIIMAFTLRFIRKSLYELFRVLHQTMAVIFFIGVWNHCKTLGWMECLYVAIFFWVLDHAIRLGKIVLSGGLVMAQCELSKDEITGELHSIRFTISHSGRWRAYPGCYVFIYFLRPAWVFWQSHPFTIVENSSDEYADQLTVIVRIKKGITKTLGSIIQKTGIKKLPILVEGPYGTPIAFRNYHNAVFIAGGVGITIIYTLAVDLAKQYRAYKSRENKTENKILMIWLISSYQILEVCQPEIQSLIRTPEIELRIFLTREVPKTKHIQIHGIENILQFCKPDILKEVSIEDWLGNTALVACGPDRLNRDVRRTCAKLLKSQNGNRRVEYFEEELLW